MSDMDVSSDTEALYEAYVATPEGAKLCDILTKIDRLFQTWSHNNIVLKCKKELLVEIIETFINHREYRITETSEKYTPLE